MQVVPTKLFCLILVGFGGLSDRPSFADPAQIAFVVDLVPGLSQTNPFSIEDSFVHEFWSLERCLRKHVLSDDWVSDPWGFKEATSLEYERAWDHRLRSLAVQMQQVLDSEGEEGIFAVWSGMRKRSEPTGKVKIRHEMTQSRLYSKTKIDFPEHVPSRPEPYQAKDWRAEEMLRLAMPMFDSLFVFGHFNSNADGFVYQELTAVAKTGLGVRWVPITKSELQLRGGPMMTYTDTYSSTKIQEKSRFAVELLAIMPLFGPFSLEYTGAAIARSLPTDSNQINQDLRIALPIGARGEFYFGARHLLESYAAQPLWTERRQVYLGIELKH